MTENATSILEPAAGTHMPHADRAARAGRVLITGATGFIGRRLLQRLHRGACETAVCLTRRQPALAAARDVQIELVTGELARPESYDTQLASIDTVVHLAAVTGRRPRREYYDVNLDGTRKLLAACRAAGVRRFLHVSTIAAGYQHKSGYDYAKSKELAEQAVRESGLRYTIVRPTIVLGERSPAWAGLAKLASLPVVPMFNGGRAETQPIDVDDVAIALVRVLADDHFHNETIDLGGPERLRMRDLLTRIHRACNGREPRTLPVPLPPVMFMLALLEPLFLPFLPVTRGQLQAFRNDSIARPHPLIDPLRDDMANVEDMLASSIAPAPPLAEAVANPALDRESVVFCRYLTGAAPTDYVRDRYADAHDKSTPLRDHRFDVFDRVLVKLASCGPVFTRLADAYSRFLKPRAVIRKKLVLLLAILECSSPAHEVFDEPTTASPAAFWLALAMRGCGMTAVLLLAIFLLAPLHLACTLLSLARRAN
jgi:NADH dehydrogenase